MGDNKEIILILIGLFILFGVAFKPLKEAADRNSGDGSTSSRQSSIGRTSREDQETKPIDKIKDIEKEIENLGEILEKNIEEGKRSPYYGKINMSNISGRNNSDPSKEYIRLSVNLDGNEEVNISGWYLRSAVTGYYVVIGRASLLPFPFTYTYSDVVLKDGDKVILTKGFSPIGISFRTNICTGYFEENRTFHPSLSKQCPDPEDEILPTFSSVYERDNECIEIIERIPRCTTRGNEYLRDLPDTVSQICKTYIKEQVNYNSCVAKHFGDTDFPGQEYRLFFNKFGPLWRKEKEKINLHDHNNLIVDTISY